MFIYRPYYQVAFQIAMKILDDFDKNFKGCKKDPWFVYRVGQHIHMVCSWSNKRHKKGTSNILNCRRYCYIYIIPYLFSAVVCACAGTLYPFVCVEQQSVLELVTTICSWRERWENPTLAPLFSLQSRVPQVHPLACTISKSISINVCMHRNI